MGKIESNSDEIKSLQSLKKIARETLKLVDDDPSQGLYLLSFASIESLENKPLYLRTAISLRDSDIEFSTFISNLPNTEMCAAALLILNSVCQGKFIGLPFKDVNGPSISVIYVTSKPKVVFDKKFLAIRKDKEITKELRLHALIFLLGYTVLNQSLDLDGKQYGKSSFEAILANFRKNIVGVMQKLGLNSNILSP